MPKVICPKCGKKVTANRYCSNCGSLLKGAKRMPEDAIPSIVLILLGIAIVFAAIILAILILAGVFASPTGISIQLSPEISGCDGTMTYTARLTSGGNDLQDATISTYENGNFVEQLKTDQNGRITSTINAMPAWCGKNNNITFIYAGDYLHKGSSTESNLAVKAPTKIAISAANETLVDQPTEVNISLVNALDNSPVKYAMISVHDGITMQLSTDASGSARANFTFIKLEPVNLITDFAGTDLLGPSSDSRIINVLPVTCSDGTIVGECSDQESFFCDQNKSLIFDCTRCGCSAGLVCFQNTCTTPEARVTSLISELQDSIVLVQNDFVQGSGVILSSNDSGTVILTNRHVVDSFNDGFGSEGLTVRIYGGQNVTPYKVLVAPTSIDFALIYLKGEYGTPAKINYSQNLTKGEEIIAIGSPLGLESSISKGIISNLGRLETINGTIPYDVIQTDAAINPGNSGGGMFRSSNGDLIGINTEKIKGTGIEGLNFAIDIKELKGLPPFDSWAALLTKPRCDDGTLYNICSASLKGRFCSSYGSLIDACGSCGCPSDYPFCGVDGRCFTCYPGYLYSFQYRICCPAGWTAAPGGCCPPGSTYSEADGKCHP